MDIQGLQKMTLLDFPGKVACTVFLGDCDFRCPFCHNFQLVTGPFAPVMDEGAFLAFLDTRQGLLDGVAITGGEPCLRRDLPKFLARIRERGFGVKLDTNGTHPQMLARLLEEGLVDYVAMDVKNSPAKYAATVGLAGRGKAFPQVLDFGGVPVEVRSEMDLQGIDRSIALLKGSGIACEFRTTVVREFHEPGDFEQIGRWIEGADQYFLQAFTERDAVPDRTLSAPSPDELRAFRDIVAPHVGHAAIRGVD